MFIESLVINLKISYSNYFKNSIYFCGIAMALFMTQVDVINDQLI